MHTRKLISSSSDALNVMSGIALDANLLMKFACVKRVCFMVVRFGKSAVELQRPLHLGSDMSFDQDLVTSIDIASADSQAG